MAGIESRSFNSPDEIRTPDNTKVDVVRLDGTTAARLTLEPGWSWSSAIKPIAGTHSCEARHIGVVQSGTLHVKHDDGTETELAAGDAYVIEPGHDAWVVGDEAVVSYEFEPRSAEDYASGR